MSQQSLSTFLHASLLVRDIHGHYLPATDKQILDAACQIIDLKMQRGAQFTAASSTRDYLSVKLANYEREVFVVLFLDMQNRLIEYAEMFHGSIGSTEVHPREIVKRPCRITPRQLFWHITIRAEMPNRATQTER